jgi:hypothetical protein
MPRTTTARTTAVRRERTAYSSPASVSSFLVQIQAITGDDRYRPSQWLRRRAMLGMSAMTPEQLGG